jgi:hypothetical protein
MMTTKVMAGVEWRFLWNYWFAWYDIMVDTELLLRASACISTSAPKSLVDGNKTDGV